MSLRCLVLVLGIWVCAFVAHAQDFSARARVRRRMPALQAEDATASGTALDIARRESVPQTLGDVLREAPGARVTNTGGLGAFSSISLRGAEFDETLVLIDEIPLQGPDGGAFDLSIFPPSLFERAEVYRGGAPVWLGSGAIAGVLRLVPRRAQRASVSASAGTGSFNTENAQLGVDVQGPSGLASRAHVVVRHSDGDFPYRDDGGTRFDRSDDSERRRQNAQLDDASALLDVDLPTRAGTLHLVGLGFTRSAGFPGPASQPTPAIHRVSIRGLLGGSFMHEKSDAHGLRRKLQLVSALSATTERYADIYGQLGTSKQTATDDHGYRVFVRAAATERLWRWLEGSLIASYAHDRYDPFNAYAFPRSVPSDRDTIAAAGELRLFGAVRGHGCELRPSVRAEWSRTHVHAQHTLTGGFDNTQAVLAPTARIGGAFELMRGLALSVSSSTGRRLPTMFELFGDRGLTLPSPTLRPVRSRTVDGGFVVQQGLGFFHVQSEARVFFQERRDAIVPSRTAQYQVLNENVSRVRQWGVESGLTVRFNKHADIHSAFTWLEAENALGKRLPFRARYVTYVRPEAHLDFTTFVSRAALFGELSHRSFAYVDRANQAYVPACLKVALGASMDLFRSALRLAARMDDVGDVRCTDLIGYPLPGRSLFFTMTFEEDFRADKT